MNYELAKELKETGFLQEGVGSYKLADNFDTVIFKEDMGKVYIPTFSELIEACEELDSKREINFGWFFLAKKYGTWLARTLIGDGEGNTKEEAVAHLWLALKK